MRPKLLNFIFALISLPFLLVAVGIIYAKRARYLLLQAANRPQPNKAAPAGRQAGISRISNDRNE